MAPAIVLTDGKRSGPPMAEANTDQLCGVGMTFGEVVIFAAGNREFVENLDRLRGTSFATIGRGGPMVDAIDKATGYQSDQCAEFCALVYELVWSRMPQLAREGGH